MANELNDREQKQREYMRKTLQSAIEQRSKDREFHGLNREFIYHQARMLDEYRQAKDIKHPRDVGNARENILRNFFMTSGYLPPKYGISNKSARVVSSSGHISNEIDILFYDALNVTTLMKRNDAYEVYPIECVHGVIQIKSRLSREEVRNGLNNLASFKKLCGPPARDRAEKRKFAILFSYDSDISWKEIINEIETFSSSNTNTNWSNAIFILNEGYIMHGQDNKGSVIGYDIEQIKALKMFGAPDRDGMCLYAVCSIVNLLLSDTETRCASMDTYLSLPLIAEDLSYRFAHGQFAEVGRCPQHGDYARKISADSLRRIVQFCAQAQPINWIRATELAYGKVGDNHEAYRRQPGDVRIYNPDNLPLSDILVMNSRFEGKEILFLAFDTIQSSGMEIYLPYYYSVNRELITDCPICAKNKRRRVARQASKKDKRDKD